MKKILTSLVLIASFGLTNAHAEAVIKEKCEQKTEKVGNKTKTVNVCKKIKVHKKLEGRAVPNAK